MKYLLILAALALTACVNPDEEAHAHKRAVTLWAGVVENPRTEDEALWGQSCSKIRCTEPTRYTPVQP